MKKNQQTFFFIKWLSLVFICFLHQIDINAAITLTLSNGDLVITGDAANEDLEINYSSPDYVIISNAIITTSIAGSSGSGTTNVTVPENSVNGITVNLQNGSNRLFVAGLPNTVNGNFNVMNGSDLDQVFVTTALNTATNDILINTELYNMSVAGSLTTTTGNITINANANETATIAFNAIAIAGNITTTTGTITFIGKSGPTGNSDGVQLLGSASISSTGTSGAGTIAISGISLSTDDTSADGIVAEANTSISSANGNISITGTSIRGEGIVLAGSITATGTAGITINGTNNVTPADNRRAITMNAATVIISTVNGDISLIADSGDDAILIQAGASIASSGSGNISINGTTNNAGDQAVIITDGASLSTSTGNITLTAIGGNNDLRFTGTGSTVNSGSGNLSLIADQIEFTNTSLQGTGNLIIQAHTVTSSIGVGGGAGSLQITDDNLTTIQDGFNSITIGDATSGTGTITIQSATFTDPVTFAGGTIVDADDAGDDVAASTNVVTIDGDLAPGSSPGIFQVTGNLALTSGNDFAVEINAATTAGTDYDQAHVVGTVNLGNANLNLSGTHTPMNGDEVVIVSNDGADAITGTFNGLSEGGVIAFNGENFSISYVGGDGNDVVLSYTTASVTTPTGIPTLSEWGLIILGLLLMIFGVLYQLQPQFRALQK